MSNKRKKQTKKNRCQSCGGYAPKGYDVCEPCGDDLERDMLVDMYGEEDGEYLATIGFIPGDN